MAQDTKKTLLALLKRIQRDIRTVRGVHSAKLVLDEDGEVLEAHLISSDSRSPKQIVRDVESLLFVRYGIRLDYRRVSIVQFDTDQDPEESTRLGFVSAVAWPENGGSVRVILASDGPLVEGTSHLDAPPSQESNARAAADATLRAVQKAVGGTVPLAVQDVEFLPQGDSQLCLAVISAITSCGKERLIGTCFVIDDLAEAVSKATLDAINRRLPVWTLNNEGKKAPDVAVPAGAGQNL